MLKSFMFRIYPNRKQEVALISTLTTCRHLYNDSLAERKQQSKNIKVFKEYPIYQDFDIFPGGYGFDYINYYDQANQISKNKTEYQKDVHSQVLQNVLKRVERSFKNFFNGSGYPRFQGKNRYDSFTFPQAGYSITENGKLKLSKIGEIKIIQHRSIEGKVKICTIKRDEDQWYCMFSCEINQQPLTLTDKSIGIDVGLKSLVTLSNGKQINPPKYLRESEKKLAKAQRELSRKHKGSKNRNKARIKVAKIHRKIRNQRKDFNHKLSRTLVNTYDTIIFEKLQIQNMVKNHHLAKSISDAGWGQLVNFTKSKAEYAGRVVKQVNPRNTSKTCCVCGHIQATSLSQRIFNCEKCDNVMDRDENASINIKSRAIGTIVQACGRDPIRDLMKQEAPCL